AQVRAAFRTIEAETTNYIIGSVALPGYAESEDVHVYVHKDGWFLAYYLKADPVAKIFDWITYSATPGPIPTKLENALTLVTAQVGIPFTTATYYDFRYPNSSRMMLIAESNLVERSTDSFEVNLPSNFTYDERSWSLGFYGEGCCGDRSYLYLANTLIGQTDRVNNGIWAPDMYGTLTSAQLLPSTIHNFKVETEYGFGYSGLALIYRVP
nr:hypothetical protein [Ardenticatenales bacterium]